VQQLVQHLRKGGGVKAGGYARLIGCLTERSLVAIERTTLDATPGLYLALLNQMTKKYFSF